MEQKKVKKEWVKNAIIIFLVVMLILTFCSDTIMNMYLPEVSTEAVTSGKIQDTVRGTGTAELSQAYQVKWQDSREIKNVHVKVGQKVGVGDVLFTLSSSDGTELDTAKSTYLELQTEYQKKLLGAGTSFDKELQSIETAKKDYDKAVAALNGIETKKKELKTLQSKLTGYETKITTYDSKILEYDANIADLSAKVDLETAQLDVTTKQRILVGLQNELSDLEADYIALKNNGATQQELVEQERLKRNKAVEVNNAQADLNAAVSNVDKVKANIQSLSKEKKNRESASKKLTTYKAKQVTLSTEIEALKATIPSKEEAQSAVDEKENIWNGMISDYEVKKSETELAESTEAIELNALKQKLVAQKGIVEELSKTSSQTQIKSEMVGIVSSVSCSAGDMASPEITLATIASEDDGFSVKISVTKEQATKVKAGQNANLENYWYGDNTAVLASITADPETQGNSLLTFAVSGEYIAEGDSMTISIGGESKSYDLLVPKSSVYEDNNGKFVLTMDSKNTPLGTRYIATRHDVEVLAQDDTKAAISSDLYGYEYVITTSSEEISSGVQVKLKE